MKRVFLPFNLLLFIKAANMNAAPEEEPERVTREELLSLFAQDLRQMSGR